MEKSIPMDEIPARVTQAGGLIRSLAGPGATLSDAFEILERAPAPVAVLVHPHRKVRSGRFDLPPEEGSGYYELTRVGTDLFVIVADVAYKNPRVELVPGDGRMQFCYNLCGDLTLGISREPLRMNKPGLLVYTQPAGIDMQEWMAPRARERLIALTFRPEYLLENFLTTADQPSAKLAALAGAQGKIEYMQGPLSPAAFDLATRLIDNPYSGTLRLVHIEGIALALLTASVHECALLADAPSEEYSDRDLRRLNAAKDFLMRQLSPAPTIRQVSRSAGMSETPLKHGFKAVFGETIFDFSIRCRMQHALAMLRGSRVSVSQIAESVGYSHPSTFATAFRRHFGMSPSEVRSVAR